MILAYWVHHWDPFLFKFTDTIGVRYYGLAYVLGFVGAAWIMIRYVRTGRTQLTETQIGDLMVSMVIGVIAGGRLGYFLLYDLEAVLANPMSLLRVWSGGMSFHGGLLGVALAIVWSSWRQKIPSRHIADVVASVTSIGLLFGRLANFINGELWGRIATVPWAVIFPQSVPARTDFSQIAARHPSQLYEAFLEGAVLLAYAQWRYWRTAITRVHPGQLAGEYLIGYGVARIVCEVFREPDAELILGLSRGTFYSIFLFVAGAGFILRSRTPVRK